MGYTEVGNTDGVQFNFDAPGVELEGAVVELTDEIDGEYGTYRFLIVAREGEENAKVLAGSVLKDKIVKADPNPGDLMKIVFNGLKKSKANPSRSYNDWSVFIDRKSPKTNWDEKDAF